MPADNAIFDLGGTLRRLGGDEGLLADLIQLYDEDSPGLLRRLQLGVQCQSADEVRHAAHSLRGLAANFGAAALNEILYKLEDIATQGDLETAPTLCHKAEAESVRLQGALAPYHR